MNALDFHFPGLAPVVLMATALICSGLIILLRPLLQRYALARPNARSSHKIPTPQGAGIAVVGATLLVTVTWTAMMGLAIPVVLVGCTALMALVGLVDDIKPIPVAPRLLLQAAAVGTVLVAAPADLRLVPWAPLAFERIVLLIAGLWFVNLVNFMDGLDLMTVAETVPITGAMILFGWFADYPAVPTITAAALCGAMLGFAPFNRPVAKVFLGDVGSLAIGLLLGWCLMQLAWHHQLMAALLLPFYYLADATLTLLRRILRKEPFWVAHRTHFYQRATDNGYSVTHVVTVVFTLNLLLSALAFVSLYAESIAAEIALFFVGALLVATVLHRFSALRSAKPTLDSRTDQC
jgi:UDP-N-acetylmuramyl pentapeptide phosphotransferase/UDP-N-acetylglucosamine-1-phosphate transferase